MTTSEGLAELNPATRAVAEVRAREAGLTLSQWLEQLVFEYGAANLTRHLSVYRGGSAVENAPLGLRELDHRLLTSLPLALGAAAEIGGATSSALHLISWFPERIDRAAILLSAAFVEAAVKDFRLPVARRAVRKSPSRWHWYDTVIDTCVHRSREVRKALVHRWTPTGRAEQLWTNAFLVLSELTPARYELVRLCRQDRSRASTALAKYLEVATEQFELSAKLLTDFDAGSPAEESDEDRFEQLRASLLERAGGGVSLTEGALRLGISRQALHKRIKSGTALGMMDGDELVLPRLQWREEGNQLVAVPGLAGVAKLFESAGGWSALQFLLDPDPNLGTTPIDALREGRLEDVVGAARAYLGADEG